MAYRDYKLWERELLFRQSHQDFPEPKYAVVWEDPLFPDEPVKITRPSPAWLAMAMHGGILPPVEVYWALEGGVSDVGQLLLHKAPPVGPMTEEEAMEYLIKKDIPRRVWRDYKGNRQILRIVPSYDLWTKRDDRNSWQLNQEAA